MILDQLYVKLLNAWFYLFTGKRDNNNALDAVEMASS